MCDYLGIDLGRSEVITFSDGNIFVRILETVRGKNIYLVQPIALRPNEEFVEILFWIDAFKRASARDVTVIIPYFGYAKGDKKDEPRVSIRARVCADAIEMVGADRTITMDLHSPQVQGFFRKPIDHLYALPSLCAYIKQIGLVDEDLVVVSPDAGFAKVAREYGLKLDVPVAIGDKIRRRHDENAEILDIIGDVNGKNALIVDDFSISGGTLVNLANGLVKRGAKRIIACLSHILLNDAGVKKIEDSPIELVVSTDSVENPYISNSKKIKIISVAPLFAEVVKRIESEESVSILFEDLPANLVKEVSTI
ncbi:ribose-phosphate pyrophosphokinase [Anoxybacter fermentans]|uniref:ribose-phosphate diphosphokinase n=2 Tax=Anoxybacter fermentans TaxID=1323375 RepID=A0A3Q9HUZ1_9FIRM|nr:ribose-phosphate pyrophosphokinase [Anoxybacter fermentans]